jgi:hypothetical protein
MITLRGQALACALLVAGLSAPAVSAGEVAAQSVCGGCRPAVARYYYAPVTGYSVTACYDPCPPVGPIRRFLRRVFRPCCPPPVLPPPVVVRPAVVAPACPPPAVVGPPAAVSAPAPFPEATIPPAAPPAPAPVVPGSNSSLRREGVLTPPTPPLPVRLDRIASRSGEAGQPVVRAKVDVASTTVLLVHAQRSQLRQEVRCDAYGRFTAELSPGSWLVYTHRNGQPVYRGRVQVQEHKVVRVQLPPSEPRAE